MNVNDVITKLRVMLGAETETVETKMAEAELVDGTIVYTDGDLAVGATLMVKPAEGEEAVFAPLGMHETTDGFLVEVGEAGEILSIEEKATDAVEAEEEVIEEEMAEEEVIVEEEMSTDDLLEAIVELIKPQSEELKKLTEELSTLKERFNKIADEPAATKVRNTFSQEAADANSKAEARLERLLSIRKGK